VRRRWATLFNVLLLTPLFSAVMCGLTPKLANADIPGIHRITFPVEGRTSYSNDFGAPRSGGRTHQGNDIMGSKMQHELAAVDGVITSQKFTNSGLSGNFMQLTGDDGWKFWYIHLNNDTPGTDDGVNNPQYIVPDGITVGTRVHAGQFIAYMGDSGDAEGTSPHLHFEMHEPDGTVVNPYPNLRLSQGLRYGDVCHFNDNPASSESASSASGYWQLGSDGGVFTFGSAQYYGSKGGQTLNQPVIAIAATPSGNGYYLVASDGGIFTYGDARYYGSKGGQPLNQPIVGMAVTPSGNGYWMVASDGGIFTFGDAGYYGSKGGQPLNQSVRGMAPTSNGQGYWLFARDGGIFTFGNANFYGSAVGISRAGTVAMTPTPSGNGYWMVGGDSGVFSFGDAGFYGSIPGFGYCNPVGGITMASSDTAHGYWIQAVDGTIWGFGDAKYFGSVRGSGIPANIIGFALKK
jgi:hypothetical protein